MSNTVDNNEKLKADEESTVNKNEQPRTPPQPPLRTSINRGTLNRQMLTSSPSPQTTNSQTLNSNQTPMINQHENASSAAAKLVLKSAKMGSANSLTTSSNSSSANNPAHSPYTKIQDAQVQGAGTHHVDNRLNRDSPSLSYTSSLSNGATKNNPQANNKNSLPWALLGGEFIVNKDENDMVNYSEIIFVLPDHRAIKGKLYITNFRLYFKSDEPYLNKPHIIIDLPLGFINRIEKLGHQSVKQNNFYGLIISCKNGRKLRFATRHEKGVRKQIVELLHKYAFPISNNLNYFAYSFKKQYTDSNGWQLYDVKQEYERMGISKSNDWRFSYINQNFKFCDTYPKVLVVPQSVSDEELREVGEFRSKHRIPVASWLKYDSRKNHVALLRSSQPLTGLTQKRSDKDETYLHTIYKINTINSYDKLFIMDARPVVNALANRTTGGGYENEDNYKVCEICFLNIHNIHVMRESLRKVFEMSLPQSSLAQQALISNNANSSSSSNFQLAATLTINTGSNPHQRAAIANQNLNNPSQSSNAPNTSTSVMSDDKNFFMNLENSKWLEYIRGILNGALKIVKYINDHNSSVLVHCSDGWDRTAQLTSLSMLMMDKYYRTLRGFQVLIEKEWLSFGHRFGIRMGHGTDKHSDQDRSPIFLQFIDCVWQIMQQNSKVFEFNENLLLAIVNNMYTCQFGTFLYNNEYERERHEVRAKTVSFWSYINSYKNEFKNSAYIEHDGVIKCSTSLVSLQLWTNYYFQYKDIIDDSPNDSKSSSSQSSITSNNSYSYLPIKTFGQAFIHQVVNQMKASVRTQAPQEPELVRYRASIQ